MFRKILQSVLKGGRRVLDDKARVSKFQVFKSGRGFKAEKNARGRVSDARINVQNITYTHGWLPQFCKDGFPSKAMVYAQKQNVNLRRFNPLFTFSRRLGVSSSLYAFVAFNINLTDKGNHLSGENHFHHVCQNIKESVLSKEEQNPSAHQLEDNQAGIRNIDFGEMISKGSDSAVHKARKTGCGRIEEVHSVRQLENETNLNLMTNDNSYDLAVKMMFNFDYESNSDAIVRGMKKELLPLQEVYYYKKTSLLSSLFRNSTPQIRRRLAPHPNIIKIEEFFVDDVQELAGCHDEYPASLPFSVNPRGFGRNRTLYIVMKRFPFTLEEYLYQQKEQNLRLSVLLFLQLIEGVLHLQSSNIAHRDIKNNNILIGLKDTVPQVVITDFGCSFDGSDDGLLARYENDIVDKGGNAALMAPEIACANPAPGRYLDFRKSDLWAAGAVAYEIFGTENPFYAYFSRKNGTGLRNTSYTEDELPDLPAYVPWYLNKLVKSILSRTPEDRPDTLVVANVLHILLWAPEEWLGSLKSGIEMCGHGGPCSVDVMRWLLVLTADYILDKSESVEHTIKGLFLARLDLDHVMEAVDLLWGMT